MKKRIFALVLTVLFIVAAVPVAGVGETPEGYDEHDYWKIRNFLEIADENNIKNGNKISENYSPYDPTTWTGTDSNGYSTECVWTSDGHLRSVYFQASDVVGELDLHRLVGAVVDGVIIHRAVDCLSRLQLFQVPDHQIRVEGVGMVVILLAALLKGAVLPLVVVVVVHHGDVVAEPGHQMLGEGGLAAAGTSGDADEDGVHIAASRIRRFRNDFCLYYRELPVGLQGNM